MSNLRGFLLLVFLAVLLIGGIGPSELRAQPTAPSSIAPVCHSASEQSVSTTGMIVAYETRSGWNCSDSGWRANRPVAWLWFDAKTWENEQPPRFFFSRIARFQSITFTALDAEGTSREVRYAESDGEPFAAGPVFKLELPEISPDTRALIVRVERPHSVPLLTEARLTQRSQEADWTKLDIALLAFILGMLILPLLFDLSFFIVLREKFVALHAVMVVAMMGYVLFAGGLISLFASFDVRTMAIAAPLFWAVGCGMSALFLAEFLEPRAQSSFMRRLTKATGYWTILVPGFFSLQLHATQAFDDRGYFITFIPAIILISAAIVRANARGSISARFVAIGWFPIILASLERMMRGFGVYTGPSNLDQMLYIATGIEVIVISLAIAQRFLALRLERDAAVTEARMLERLSERDPLTGLMNRRAVTQRFGDLRAQGFDTLALIDLDMFKEINDRFGHQVGDEALKACAEALRGDDDRNAIGVRLGGEEFVVLLRGKNAHARAEAMRRSIPIRIASAVPGLDRPVTASMGLVELPRDATKMMSFDELYARADQLLYHAKAAGRNRTCFERLTVFKQAPRSRAASEAAA
jgi:diguanylate cyclase (GGDEF)-like protein